MIFKNFKLEQAEYLLLVWFYLKKKSDAILMI